MKAPRENTQTREAVQNGYKPELAYTLAFDDARHLVAIHQVKSN